MEVGSWVGIEGQLHGLLVFTRALEGVKGLFA